MKKKLSNSAGEIDRIAAALKGVTVLAVGVPYEAGIEIEPNEPVTLRLKVYITDASLDELRELISSSQKIIIIRGE